MNAEFIVQALKDRRYKWKDAYSEYERGPGNTWAFFTEFDPCLGYKNRYVDVMEICCVDKYQTIAYEIKVSRGDFLQELKHPEKREKALRYAAQFFFAAPAGMIKPHELPPEAGLIEVYENGRTQIKVSAPQLNRQQPDWVFVASVARHAARIQRYSGQVATAEDLHDLRKDLHSIRSMAIDGHWGQYYDKNPTEMCAKISRRASDILKRLRKFEKAVTFKLGFGGMQNE